MGEGGPYGEGWGEVGVAGGPLAFPGPRRFRPFLEPFLLIPPFGGGGGGGGEKGFPVTSLLGYQTNTASAKAIYG